MSSGESHTDRYLSAAGLSTAVTLALLELERSALGFESTRDTDELDSARRLLALLATTVADTLDGAAPDEAVDEDILKIVAQMRVDDPDTARLAAEFRSAAGALESGKELSPDTLAPLSQVASLFDSERSERFREVLRG